MSKTPPNKFEDTPPDTFELEDAVKIDTSVRGWKHIVKIDRSAVIKGLFSLVVLVIIALQGNWLMFGLVAGVAAFNITVELFNTCIELICDYLTNEYDERIKLIKDVAAASTNVAYLLWVAVVVVAFVQVFL